MNTRAERFTKPSLLISKKHIPIILATCGLILITTFFLTRSKISPQPELQILKRRTTPTFAASIEFSPSLDTRNGSDFIWQIPNSPKAVLFIAPGCTIRASDFWDKSPECPHCVGLPEERLFVLEALERGFAVLTVSSWDQCWSFDEEMGVVEWIIKWWVVKNRLENLPMVALGASSGGYFVSDLATKVKFSSISVMIAEGVFGSIKMLKDYPPTLFVHMPKDQVRMKRIIVNMKALKEKGVDVKEVRCEEFPVSPDFLAERIPGFSRSFAVELLDLFQKKGFVDEKGYMKKDGRNTPWMEALEESKLSPKNFEWAKHVNEQLNLAFAYHEFSSVHSEEIFDWFESHMKLNS